MTPERTEPGGVLGSSAADAAGLALELRGELRCAGCRYDLRGLSIVSDCPECGLPVRATLLARVDPRAAEIQRIGAPRVVLAGLLLWAFGLLGTLVLVWVAWGLGLARDGIVVTRWGGVVASGAAGCAGVAAIGALVIIRPHGSIPAWKSVGALVGILALGAGAWLIGPVLGAMALGQGIGEPGGAGALAARRALVCTLGMVSVLGLRWNLRVLVARSVLLRTGRVERQTLAAVGVAFGVTALGDLLELGATRWGGAGADLVHLAAMFLVGVGGVFLLVGCMSIVVDTVRLAPVVLRRPLAMRDVVGDRPRDGEGAGV